MAIWYHYIRETNLRSFADRRILKGRSPFILPRDFSAELPEEAKNPAIWGLHCPEPDVCSANTEHSNPHAGQIRKDIARGETLYLLEITTPNAAELLVADTSVFKDIRALTFPENVEWNSRNGKKLRRDFDEKSKIHYVQYWESLIPFENYKPGQYQEPEIVCFNAVPFSQIRCVKKTDEFKPPPPKPELLAELFDF